MPITVATIKAVIGLDDTDLTKGLQKAKSAIDNFGKGVGDLGKKMSLNFTAPLLALGTAAVKVESDYESAMNQLRAATNATNGQFEAMSVRAKQLGADLSLPNTSAKSAAEAMLALAKGGLTVRDVMDSTKTVLQLSAAAGVDNARAAEIVASALDEFSLKGKDAAHVADLLAAAGKSTQGGIDNMSYALQYAGQAASTLHIPIDKVVTALTLMGRAGITGSSAGESLRTALVRLAQPGGEARKVLEEQNIQLFDSAGRMKDLSVVAGILHDKLGKLTEQQRVQVVASIGGIRAMQSLFILAKNGSQGFDEMTKHIEQNGAAAKLAAAQMQGLPGALKAIQTTFMSAMQSAIEPITKDLQALAKQVANLLSWFAQLPQGTRRMIVEFLAGVAAAGPLLIAFSRIIAALRALLPVFNLVKAGAMALWAALGGPATIAIGLVIAAVTALWLSWHNNWGHIQEFTYAVWDTIKDAFNDGKQWIEEVWDGLTGLLTGNWENAWDNIKKAAVSAIKFIVKLITDPIGVIKDLATAAGTHMGEELAKSAQRAAAKAKPVIARGAPVDLGPGRTTFDYAGNGTADPNLPQPGDSANKKKSQSDQINDAIAQARVKLILLRDGVKDSLIDVVGQFDEIHDGRRKMLADLNDEIAAEQKNRNGKIAFKAALQDVNQSIRAHRAEIESGVDSLEQLRKAYPGVTDAQLEYLRNQKEVDKGLEEQKSRYKEVQKAITDMRREQHMFSAEFEGGPPMFSDEQRFAMNLYKQDWEKLTQAQKDNAAQLFKNQELMENRNKRIIEGLTQRRTAGIRASVDVAFALMDEKKQLDVLATGTDAARFAMDRYGVTLKELLPQARNLVRELTKVEQAKQAFQDLTTGLNSLFTNMLENLNQGFKGLFQMLVDGVNKILIEIAAKIVASRLTDLLVGLIGGAFGKTMSNGAWHPPMARADGGMVDAGKSYLVGEHGPELVTFANQGRVFSTAETAMAMSNSGAHAPINIHIHAADAGSIIRSKQQIAQDLGVAIDRARRRNG